MRVLIAPLFAKEPQLERVKRIVQLHTNADEVLVAQTDQVAKQLIQHGINLVVACVGNIAFDRELESVQRLRGMTEAPIFAIGPATDPKLILRTVQIGADVFLDQADLDNELRTAFARLQSKSVENKGIGRLIAILSSSGGCGASTLAVNMAAALARDQGMCNLIDLNPGRGDLASLLDLKPQYTLADVCRNESRLDRAMFEKMLERHESGIRLLAAPARFDDARSIGARGINQAVTFARSMFANIVVDAEDCFHDEQLAVLKQANLVLLVGRLDFTSMRNARRMIEHLSTVGVVRSRIKPVINFHGQPNELPLEEAQDALGLQIEHYVPYDPKTINEANNIGQPAFSQNPQSRVCQAIADLAKVRVETQTRSGLLPTLKSLWKAIG